MLIKPFGPLLSTKKNPAEMSYLGTVEDNNDPDKHGKVKVRIAPYSDMTTEQLPWACPILGTCGNSSNSGGLNIPDIGSQVRVEFPSRDLTAPYYKGAELNDLNRVTLFDEDYPHTYGYKDANGNFIKVNKEKGTIHLQHESTTNIQVTPDGTIKCSLRGGSSFILSSYNSFDLDIGGAEIKGMPDGSLECLSESDISIQALQVNMNTPCLKVSGDVAVGNGASGVIWALNGVIIVKDGIITSINGGK